MSAARPGFTERRQSARSRGRATGAASRMATLQELLDADEVFACGTAAEVAPISRIEDREYGSNPVTRAIAAHYQRVVRGEDVSYRHWLTAV